MPTITQFEIFAKTIDEGSFTKAGHALHMSQPAVSHAIATLESELGVTLLLRDRRKGLILTDIGQRVLVQTRNIIDSLEKIDQEISAEKGLEKGSVHLASFPTVTAHFLPKIISTFQQQRPNLSLSFQEGTQKEIKEWLTSRAIDIGFVVLPCEEMDTFPLIKDHYVVMLPDGHPLLKKTFVSLSDLENEPFIKSTGGYETPIVDLIKKQGFTIREEYMISNLNTSLSMIQEGLGLIVLPELSMKNLFFSKNNIRPLETTYCRHIALAVPSLKESSRAVQLFIQITKELFG